ETDANGRFTLHHLPRTGPIELHSGAPGTQSLTFSWEYGARENRERITLHSLPVVSGQVRDADTDQPLTKFDVQPGWFTDARFSELEFDETAHVNASDGRFSLTMKRFIAGEPSPGFAGRVVAPGYVPQITPKVYIGQKYDPFVIHLKRGQPITGSVQSPAG